MLYADMSKGGDWPCCEHCIHRNGPASHLLPCPECQGRAAKNGGEG